ncbi:helix-turn-helix domain-containing protein [Peribacillus frigoritolerans]|uniref:helix-turn-helix domain-containing protein n=1 Tax=Peribacillus frigoritolerans TaxID=450367 RepID=UPI0007BFAEA4
MKVRISLNEMLIERKMSQHELSRQTGIRQPSINEMCRNQTQRLPLNNLAAICKVLNCEIVDILKLEKEPTD